MSDYTQQSCLSLELPATFYGVRKPVIRDSLDKDFVSTADHPVALQNFQTSHTLYHLWNFLLCLKYCGPRKSQESKVKPQKESLAT